MSVCLPRETREAILARTQSLSDEARISVDEIIGAFPDCAVRIRKKRAPSLYNQHISRCLKGTTGDIKARFKTCAQQWKARKGAS